MDWTHARSRFAFLAEALEGSGGYAPRIRYKLETMSDGAVRTRPLSVVGPSNLIQYQRESPEKFAGRCAVAAYKNHLLQACERFVSFLSRRKPIRSDADAPLVARFLADCDMRGTPLDGFLYSFAHKAKARGSMLLLVDQPAGEAPASRADQINARRIPFLRALPPEIVTAYEIDNETGLFLSVSVDALETVDGKLKPVTRLWNTQEWQILDGDKVIAQGAHGFGACPVLSFTESGQEFPSTGNYAQIADISKRVYNAESELDEILRSQTFSLLTLQVLPDQASTFDATAVAATIGTHSMLIHGGAAPAFIAPDSGPAQVYQTRIDKLEESIRRISKEEATADAARSAESGVSRRLRFETLNAELAAFANQLKTLELRVWELFHKGTNSDMRIQVEWPSDFNLVDTMAELDVLDAMQTTGFPPLVLTEKRRVVAGAEFDSANEETKARIQSAIDEQAQESPTEEVVE
jgi:hypothetical protein